MSKVASILSIATEVPKNCVSQKKYTDFVVDNFSLSEKEKKVVYGMCTRSEINKRHTVIEDDFSDKSTWKFFGSQFPKVSPSTLYRNKVYKEHAPKLATSVAKKAIKNWGGNKEDITHIIYVSCTGLMAPGVEFLLINQLGLSPNVERFGINYMGCFGAFRALSMARAIALENKNNRVLIVCVELCSLHMQTDNSLNTVISNLLFADGAASVIVGQGDGFWSISKSLSCGFNESVDDMTWEVGNNGFLMTLTAQVPKIIRNEIKNFAKQLVNNKSLKNFSWALHPGGKNILEGIEDSLNLNRNDTFNSWDVLSKYGNMSSASILFILDAMKNDNKDTLAFGFGPGLSMEGLLLKR